MYERRTLLSTKLRWEPVCRIFQLVLRENVSPPVPPISPSLWVICRSVIGDGSRTPRRPLVVTMRLPLKVPRFWDRVPPASVSWSVVPTKLRALFSSLVGSASASSAGGLATANSA